VCHSNEGLTPQPIELVCELVDVAIEQWPNQWGVVPDTTPVDFDQFVKELYEEVREENG
jgi:hypothetical protein